MCCPDPQTISAFADGELEAGQAAEVKGHIAECASCRQLFEELRWVDDCGRAALGAIRIGEPTTAKVVRLGRPRGKWARPLSLAAAAVVILGLSMWTSSHFGRWQTTSPLQQGENTAATSLGSDGQSQESEDTAFERWAAPYRELHIPLVPMEVAARYNPAPIEPILPYQIEGNHL